MILSDQSVPEPAPLRASRCGAGGIRTVLRKVLGAALLVAMAACGGGGGSDSPATPAPPPPLPPLPLLPLSTNATLIGVVKDAKTGAPVRGARVAVGSKASVTDALGIYVLDGLPLGDTIVQISAPGHAANTAVVQTSGLRAQQTLDIRLAPVSASLAFDPATAQTLQDPATAAAVVLPVAALVGPGGAAPVGAAKVQLTPLGVTTMPGTFTSAANQSIETFGALQVNFTDAAGNTLNLAAGKTATLRIPARGAPGATLPASVPLFHFDTARSLWVQEGRATLVSAPSGAYYEGAVTHFSTWNADEAMEIVFVRGIAVDADGETLPGARVVCDGVDYAAQTSAVANTQGVFAVPVRRNSKVLCQASVAGSSSARFEETTGTIDITADRLDTQIPITNAVRVTLSDSVSRIDKSAGPLGTFIAVELRMPFTSIAMPLDASQLSAGKVLWEVTASFSDSDGGSTFKPWTDGTGAFLALRPDLAPGAANDPYNGIVAFAAGFRLSSADLAANRTRVTLYMRLVTFKQSALTGLFARTVGNTVSYTFSLVREPVLANGLTWLPLPVDVFEAQAPDSGGQTVYLPRQQTYTQSIAYCAARGYRMPTLSEALAFYPTGPYGPSSGSSLGALGAVWAAPNPDSTGNAYLVNSNGTSAQGSTSTGTAIALCTR